MSDRRTATVQAAWYRRRWRARSQVRLPRVERPCRTRTGLGKVDIHCANVHSDLHLGWVYIAELTEHPHSLVEFDERDDEWQAATRHLRGVMHDEAEHGALAA